MAPETTIDNVAANEQTLLAISSTKPPTTTGTMPISVARQASENISIGVPTNITNSIITQNMIFPLKWMAVGVQLIQAAIPRVR